MKRKIQAELVSIAHRVLQLKDHSTLSQLQEEARQLYEKLTLLHFAEQHFSDPQPTLGQMYDFLETESTAVSEEAPRMASLATAEEGPEGILAEDVKPNVEIQEDRGEVHLPESEQKSLSKEKPADKPEFVIDKVNADISEDLFVPATAEEINTILRAEPSLKRQENVQKSDAQSPPVILEEERPKSLNDQLKKNISIGLNDRLAFIKHLFEGNSADYNRVLSQLNTVATEQEASDFINNMVKPDHNWEGKEEYEERFLEIIRNRF